MGQNAGYFLRIIKGYSLAGKVGREFLAVGLQSSEKEIKGITSPQNVWSLYLYTRSISMVSKPFVFEVFVVK